jgi:hypothetical protein
MHGFLEEATGKEHVALTFGDVAVGAPVLVRLHSECLTGDALFSLRCDCGAQLEAALAAIAAEGRGVLFHCTSGKDRTGFGIALVLLAAGCPEEVVIADYELTNQWRRDVRFMFRDGVDPVALEVLTSAPGAYIAQALDQLRIEHGDAWLGALGFDAAEQRQLRHLLTEPVSP